MSLACPGLYRLALHRRGCPISHPKSPVIGRFGMRRSANAASCVVWPVRPHRRRICRRGARSFATDSAVDLNHTASPMTRVGRGDAAWGEGRSRKRTSASNRRTIRSPNRGLNRPRERQWAVYPIERARPPVPPPISDPLSTPRRFRSQHPCKWTCALADCDAKRRSGWKSKSPQAGRRADHHPMGRPGQTHDPAGAPLWCAMLRQTPGSAPQVGA